MEEETYRSERKLLNKAELEQSRLYDRAILTLTAGALGLSLTFIRQILPHFDSGTSAWLVGGWTLLLGSLLSTLVSFQTSQSGLRRQRDILDLVHVNGPEDGSQHKNSFARVTHWLNIASTLLFVAGVCCLTIFITINVGKAMASTPDDMKKGYVAPNAPPSVPVPLPTAPPSNPGTGVPNPGTGYVAPKTPTNPPPKTK